MFAVNRHPESSAINGMNKNKSILKQNESLKLRHVSSGWPWGIPSRIYILFILKGSYNYLNTIQGGGLTKLITYLWDKWPVAYYFTIMLRDMNDSIRCIRLRGQKTPSKIFMSECTYVSTFGITIVLCELGLCF